MKTVSIYALADPRVKHPIKRFFYVGQTAGELSRRLARHIGDHSEVAQARWRRPGYREKVCKALKASSRAMWRRPSYRRKVSKAMRLAKRKKTARKKKPA